MRSAGAAFGLELPWGERLGPVRWSRIGQSLGQQPVRPHPGPPRGSRCRTQQPPTQDARLRNPSRAPVQTARHHTSVITCCNDPWNSPAPAGDPALPAVLPPLPYRLRPLRRELCVGLRGGGPEPRLTRLSCSRWRSVARGRSAVRASLRLAPDRLMSRSRSAVRVVPSFQKPSRSASKSTRPRRAACTRRRRAERPLGTWEEVFTALLTQVESTVLGGQGGEGVGVFVGGPAGQVVLVCGVVGEEQVRVLNPEAVSFGDGSGGHGCFSLSSSAGARALPDNTLGPPFNRSTSRSQDPNYREALRPPRPGRWESSLFALIELPPADTPSPPNGASRSRSPPHHAPPGPALAGIPLGSGCHSALSPAPTPACPRRPRREACRFQNRVLLNAGQDGLDQGPFGRLLAARAVSSHNRMLLGIQ